MEHNTRLTEDEISEKKKSFYSELIGEAEKAPPVPIIAMGWHCFSLHCKYGRHNSVGSHCSKHGTDCNVKHCEVFKNGKPIAV